MSASPAILDLPDPCERYGLQLVEANEPPHPAATAAAEKRPLRPFEWGLLAGFAVAQIAHLAGLAMLASWALRGLLGA